jgi:hypothetical protein
MASSTTSKVQLTLVSPAIPAEVILRVVEKLPFDDGKIIAGLRKVHPRLNSLLGNYERSITRTFMVRELPHASTDFPCCDKFGFKCLSDCVRRYDTVDDVMDALVSKENCLAVEPFNMALVHAGLLLLYGLRFMGKSIGSSPISIHPTPNHKKHTNPPLASHSARLAYISSLPRDPLTALYLAINHSTLTARYHGSGWLHQSTYGRFMDADQYSIRVELEHSFAEAALSHGPSFISDTLLRPGNPTAQTTLFNFYTAFGTHNWEWPQPGSLGYDFKGVFYPPRVHGPQPEVRLESLWDALLTRLASLSRCTVDQVRLRTEEDMSDPDHALVWLGLHGKARLLKGEDWALGVVVVVGVEVMS